MYAIIEEGGRQHKVTAGDTILIDRPADDQKTVRFDRVLLIAGEGDAKIGAPHVSGASVSADVIGEKKGIKVETVKYKRRKGFHKTIGHRQKYLAVKITGINL